LFYFFVYRVSVPRCACTFDGPLQQREFVRGHCSDLQLRTGFRAPGTCTQGLQPRRAVDSWGHPFLWWVLHFLLPRINIRNFPVSNQDILVKKKIKKKIKNKICTWSFISRFTELNTSTTSHDCNKIINLIPIRITSHNQHLKPFIYFLLNSWKIFSWTLVVWK
jgi:hypothetical protein